MDERVDGLQRSFLFRSRA